MKVSRIRAYNLNYELREPLSISYKTVALAKNLLVLIETKEGIEGVGESAPLRPITGDTQKVAFQFLKSADILLKDQDPCDIAGIHILLDKLSKKLGFTSMTARAAIDSACFDILGKVKTKPVYKIINRERPTTVPNTITIYIKSIEEIAKLTRVVMKKYHRNGIRRLKIKLSGNPKLDKKRVLIAAKIFPGEFTLDANEAYKDEELALKVFNDIYDALGSRVILIEQPTPRQDLAKLRYVADRCNIPIFSDESVASYEELQRVIEEKSVKGINIKLQRAGGIYWGNKMAELAKKSKLDIMVGCVFESGIAIAQDVNFLAGISGWACGSDLDTDFEIQKNIITEGSRIPFTNGGRTPLNKPGLGIELKKSIRNLLEKDKSEAIYFV